MKEARPGRPDDGTLTIEGVRVTHPDRVLFADQGVTKKALIDYYLAVADRILPHVANRPLSLVRCPDGAGGACFFQKHASPGFPDALRPVTIREKSGSDEYLYIEDASGLVAAVQMGVLELHVWGSHVGDVEKPDRLVFDFDPDPTVSFDAVKNAAKDIRQRLEALGLVSFPMASGGKGIHVVVPVLPHHSWAEAKTFAEALARIMAAEEPDKYLAVASKAKRAGRIFIDYLRNDRGSTAVSPFSSRARPGAPVAWPVDWAGLARLKDAHPASIETAPAMLKRRRKEPWAGYFEVEQELPIGKLLKGAGTE